jgi:hypothetical protein
MGMAGGIMIINKKTLVTIRSGRAADFRFYNYFELVMYRFSISMPIVSAIPSGRHSLPLH